MSRMGGRFDPAIRRIRAKGGTVRMSDALESGISRRTLYDMKEEGVIEPLSRGLYRLTSLPALSSPDLVTVATRIPRGVICLISALAFHELTTQIPHAVDVAIARGTEMPRIDYPPVQVYRFSERSFASGVQNHVVDDTDVRIYSQEKSVADAFKYRNKIGMDVALEALKGWRGTRGASIDELLEQARACRVERIMPPVPGGPVMKRLAASVHARLANQARDRHRPFAELLQYYGLERFLYRLARSPHRERFILKGALMLRVWGAPESRPTRDIDLLGFVENETENLEAIVRAVCAIDVEDDGLSFDATTVTAQRIKEGRRLPGRPHQVHRLPRQGTHPHANRRGIRRRHAPVRGGECLPHDPGLSGANPSHLST